MENAALKLFESINNFSKIEEFIAEGETEGLYLECKSPSIPRLDQEYKKHLASVLSGFSNTEGGIIIWGVSTTKHLHGDLDVLTKIEELGNCDNFAKQIETSIPQLTIPAITRSQTKVIKKSKKDNRGIIITYVPKSIGDPVQSNKDQHFYFRNGNEFTKLPYEMLKRLFASTESPDLHVLFDSRLVIIKEEGVWEIPIILTNNSSAAAEKTKVVVEMKNEKYCQEITSSKEFRDISNVNPDKKIFISEIKDNVIYRGLNSVSGSIIVKMKKEKRFKRVLKINVTIYSNKMVAREEKMSIYVSKSGISVRKEGEKYLY